MGKNVSDNGTVKVKFFEMVEVQEENLKSLRLKRYLNDFNRRWS